MECDGVGEDNSGQKIIGDEHSSRTRRSKGVMAGVDSRVEQKLLVQKLTKIIDTADGNRTEEDVNFLAAFPAIVNRILSRRKSVQAKGEREEEKEDSPAVIDGACGQFAEALLSAKCAVVYTGAGISTAANIPDYRGRDGIWTKLRDGRELGIHDLEGAEPTLSHMALKQLVDVGIVKHVLSQNCDGLHFRSGIPRAKLSEVHGNMYIEICVKCRPAKEYVREIDVTEKTKLHSHRTGRLCYYCGSALEDTIVHFGERGRTAWPLNWSGIDAIIEDVDLILCLGSSLKVLKGYEGLWARDRPAKQRPKIYIVNLQWTPKDSVSTAKVHAKCDDFMQRVMSKINISIPDYPPLSGDPLQRTATPLHPWERHTSFKARNYFAKRKRDVTGTFDAKTDPEGKCVDNKIESSENCVEDSQCPEVKHENGDVFDGDEELEEKKEDVVTDGGKFQFLDPLPKFTKEARRTPSGYFRYTPVFRFIPAGQNPYKEIPTELVAVDEASLPDPPEWPSSEDDGAEDLPAPGPGWYGKGLRRKKPGRSKRGKAKKSKTAVDTLPEVKHETVEMGEQEQPNVISSQVVAMELNLSIEVSEAVDEPEINGVGPTDEQTSILP